MRSLATLTGAVGLVSGFANAGVNDLVGDLGDVTILHCQTTGDKIDAKHASTSGFVGVFFDHIVETVGVNCADVLDAMTDSSQATIKSLRMVNGSRGGGGAVAGQIFTIVFE